MIRFDSLKSRSLIKNNDNLNALEECQKKIALLTIKYDELYSKFKTLCHHIDSSDFIIVDKLNISESCNVQIDSNLCFVQIRGGSDKYGNYGEVVFAPLHITPNTVFRCKVGINEPRDNNEDFSDKGQTYISLKGTIMLYASCGNYKGKSTPYTNNEYDRDPYISFFIFKSINSKEPVITKFD